MDNTFSLSRDFTVPFSYGIGAINQAIRVLMGFSPTSLFTAGEQGVWYDPSDFSTMFQDAAGTTPVTAVGQPVGLILDKSGRGNHATQTTATSRPVLQQDASGRYYLLFDGVDDRSQFSSQAINTSSVSFVCAATLRAGGNFPQIIGDSSLYAGLFCGFESDGRPRFATNIHPPITAPSVGFNNRVVLSFIYDGAMRYIYVNGVLKASSAATGSFAFGTQPLLCYSGANVVTSPIDFHGGVLIGRALSKEERSKTEQFFGVVPQQQTSSVYALGDSTVAAYAGGASIMSLISSSNTKIDVSVPGHTIAQQQAVWDAQTIVASSVGWVIMQIGLNDLNPAEAASAAIGRMQTLVNTIKGEIGSRKLLVSQMIPCRQRLINIYGATNGPVAYQKWLDMNASIAGAGATPITNVDGRITSHVPLMNDGNGNLRSEYDTGDGIHPNTAGRQVNANAWVNALQQAGLTV